MSISRFSRSLTIALSILLALVSVMPASASNARRDEPPLDLPAMALRTSDFLDEGKDGFGQSYGHLTHRPRSASAFLKASRLDTGNGDEDVISGARAERTYILMLDRFHGDDNSGAFSQAAYSIILEFDDAADARGALDDMEDQWLDAGLLDTVRRVERIGDDSFYLEGNATIATPRETGERTTLAFRVENIIAAVVIINFSDDDPPTQQLTENLALRQADRIEAVIDGDEGGGLSQMALRLRVDGNNAWMDSYLALDGEWICEDLDVLTPGECDEQQAATEKNQVENYYFLKQRIAGDYAGQGTPEAWYWLFLREFSSDEAAETSFQDFRTRLSDFEGLTDLELGDEAFSVLQPSGGNLMFSVVARVDNMVVYLLHDTGTALAAEQGWTHEPSEAATLELAELQVACMEGTESCAKPARIPREMIPAELEDLT
jgi:hypothetical protein